MWYNVSVKFTTKEKVNGKNYEYIFGETLYQTPSKE